ncbi:MAG TPA: hypothetical protein VLH61_03705, partial [Bacteroidales bacterium]|nr:hypothetical protein [Bacteroidales bacterium]
MRLLTSIIFLFIATWSSGQGMVTLSVDFSDEPEQPPESFAAVRSYPDSLIMARGIDSLLTALFNYGYIDVEKKAVHRKNGAFTVFISQGVLYQWKLRNANINEKVLSANRLNDYFEGTPLPFSRFNQIRITILNWYENNGFPFARIFTDSIQQNNNLLNATLRIDPSLPIVFENVNLKGNVSLARGFTANQTGISAGAPFSEEKARMAATLLSDLPFIRIVGEPTIEFTPGTAVITVPVARRPANRFEGLAGVTNDPLQGNRLQLTGYINLSLLNLFERGERLTMNWEGLTHGTQRLLLQVNYPFLLSTPV